MKEFNPEQQQIETASALEAVVKAGNVEVYAAYVVLEQKYRFVIENNMLYS